jgi:hypothetical protein
MSCSSTIRIIQIGGTIDDIHRAAQREDNNYAYGFDSGQLASVFGIKIAELLEANRTHKLNFVGTMDIQPERGGKSATAYIFRIGDCERSINIEIMTDQQTGNA